jgi:hypothetical protein
MILNLILFLELPRSSLTSFFPYGKKFNKKLMSVILILFGSQKFRCGKKKGAREVRGSGREKS